MWVDHFVANSPLGAAATTTLLLSPDRSSGGSNFPNTPVNMIDYIRNIDVNPDFPGDQVIFQWGAYVANQNSVIANPANPFTDIAAWFDLDAIVKSVVSGESAGNRYRTKVQRKLAGQEDVIALVIQNLGTAAVFSVWGRILFRLDPP